MTKRRLVVAWQSGCLKEHGNEIIKGQEETSVGNEYFHFLIVVMALGVYTYVQTKHFTLSSLWYVNVTSIFLK